MAGLPAIPAPLVPAPLIPANNRDATAAVGAIRSGAVERLGEVIALRPDLVSGAVFDRRNPYEARTLLHVATDWPGHFPRAAESIALLVAAGADVNAPFVGAHAETPLHWAASVNDGAALVALLDAGAEIDAPGSVLTGGSALANARIFGQWDAMRLLVERGAATTLADEAALDLVARMATRFEDAAVPTGEAPTTEEVNAAFWNACRAGALAAAQFLAGRGADVDWQSPWEGSTPLDVARESGSTEVEAWLGGIRSA